jgi:hypothetical protein
MAGEAEDETPHISKEADDKLGEFHAFLFDLGEIAKRAKDERGEALCNYIHDQFCLVRAPLTGGRVSSIDLAPYPQFAESKIHSREHDDGAAISKATPA